MAEQKSGRDWPEQIQIQGIALELERIGGEAKTLAVECRGLVRKLAERRERQAPTMVLVHDALGKTHMVEAEEVLRAAEELEGGGDG